MKRTETQTFLLKSPRWNKPKFYIVYKVYKDKKVKLYGSFLLFPRTIFLHFLNSPDKNFKANDLAILIYKSGQKPKGEKILEVEFNHENYYEKRKIITNE